MSFKCKIGLHSWNGCKCKLCNKIRANEHKWEDDCETCSICGLKRKGKHRFEMGKCILCSKKQEMSFPLPNFNFLEKPHVYQNVGLMKKNSSFASCEKFGKDHQWNWNIFGLKMICDNCGKERHEPFCNNGMHIYYGPYGTKCGKCGATRDF